SQFGQFHRTGRTVAAVTCRTKWSTTHRDWESHVPFGATVEGAPLRDRLSRTKAGVTLQRVERTALARCNDLFLFRDHVVLDLVVGRLRDNLLHHQLVFCLVGTP